MAERVFVLKARQTIAAGTTELVLTTADGQPFDFTAGQNVDVTIPEPPYQDEGGNRRTFSIASAPLAATRVSSAPEIHLAWRQSASAWKRSALELPLGHQFMIAGPYGLFTLPNDKIPNLVFIAGGIGITPFHSMLGQLAASGQKPPITLLYANHDEARAAYLPELRAWNQQGVFNLLEHYGPLSLAAIKNSGLTIDAASLYYLAGPITMTNVAMEILAQLGVPRQNILIEQFTGYE